MYTCSDSYVIRVYRREESDTSQMVGLVETVGNEEKKPFTSYEELWKILSAEHTSQKIRPSTNKRRIREYLK